jgi:hypothetical protein
LSARQLLDPETDVSALIPKDLLAEDYDRSRARRGALGDRQE